MHKRCPMDSFSRNHAFLWIVVVTVLVVVCLPFWLVHQANIFSLPDIDHRSSRGIYREELLLNQKKTLSVDSTLTHSHVDGAYEADIESSATSVEKCAICFFGLPRSFKLLVLPSIVKNILIPNIDNNCDIFMHYYHVEQETSGRSGHGGTINPNDVLQLPQELHSLTSQYSNVATQSQQYIAIINDTEKEFWSKRGELLTKYRTKKDADGKYLYFPWMAKSFIYPTSIDNIVKQWHSISEVFEHMQRTGKVLQRNYSRVAMLRNDVVYVTPFDIYKTDCRSSYDRENKYAVVANWARFPVNDRMLYGPYPAVKVWATERFTRLEEHVLTYEPGYGMHSERFLNHSIFPAIRNLGIPVVANPDICFLRARADGSLWSNDCATRNGAARGFRNKNKTKALVESIVGRSCQESKLSARVTQLQCNGRQ